MKPLFLYSVLTIIFSPFIYLWLLIRCFKGKEDTKRFYERMGFSRLKRPKGKLIWMHGASVGECLSMLPLVKKLLSEDPKLHIMVTSGTLTSARLMAERLPQRAFHQYIPVDFPWAAEYFVSHWHPNAVLWFESDFWPNLLSSIYKKNIPLVLLNGRISDRSFVRWMKAKWFIQSVQKLFTLSFGQTREDVERLKTLGASNVVSVGNLKHAASQPPFDQKELDQMRLSIGSRPCWCAGSTHYNEEEMIANIHLKMKQIYKDFLTIIAPRHPNRSDEIEMICKSKGLQVSKRSRHDKITDKTDIYLADTIGEMGLIYQLAPLVFVGGSLIPFGGQNMLEPMRLGRVVVIGPHAFNFREIVSSGKTEGALIEVKNEGELLGIVLQYYKHPESFRGMSDRAEQLAMSEMSVLDRTYQVLKERVGI